MHIVWRSIRIAISVELQKACGRKNGRAQFKQVKRQQSNQSNKTAPRCLCVRFFLSCAAPTPKDKHLFIVNTATSAPSLHYKTEPLFMILM